MMRCRLRPRVLCFFLLLCSIFQIYFPAFTSTAVVTLDSIELYKTHEWLSKPSIYFHCKGEDKITLPDVKHKHVVYSFKGEESWQPLTELQDAKCKRCGFYEKDSIKSDDVFDEWELCASDFTSDGKYTRFNDKELNATLLCPECVSQQNATVNASTPEKKPYQMPWAIIVAISVSASALFFVGLVAAYKYWQKRKRQQDQARFLKLFEEGDDDLEDELGIGPLSHTI